MDKLKLLEEGFPFGLKALVEKIIRGEYDKKAGDAWRHDDVTLPNTSNQVDNQVIGL